MFEPFVTLVLPIDSGNFGRCLLLARNESVKICGGHFVLRKFKRSDSYSFAIHDVTANR